MASQFISIIATIKLRYGAANSMMDAAGMPKAPITNVIFGTMTLARVHDVATADALLGTVLEFGQQASALRPQGAGSHSNSVIPCVA
jgi:hypothetical protein